MDKSSLSAVTAEPGGLCSPSAPTPTPTADPTIPPPIPFARPRCRQGEEPPYRQRSLSDLHSAMPPGPEA